ncbi:MAG TPA: hypothetical protein VH437_03205 [Terriglobales bacterium]|jgi:hypothetical protein
MDNRKTLRVSATLPVRIWGLDANAQPFMLLASATNISRHGAAIRGVNRSIRPGEILQVQFESQIAQFQVTWVGRPGTIRDGELGISSLPAQPCIWDVNLGRCVQLAGNG